MTQRLVHPRRLSRSEWRRKTRSALQMPSKRKAFFIEREDVFASSIMTSKRNGLSKTAVIFPPGFWIKDQKGFARKLAAGLAKSLEFDRLNSVLINLARSESHRFATIPAQSRDEDGRFDDHLLGMASYISVPTFSDEFRCGTSLPHCDEAVKESANLFYCDRSAVVAVFAFTHVSTEEDSADLTACSRSTGNCKEAVYTNIKPVAKITRATHFEALKFACCCVFPSLENRR